MRPKKTRWIDCHPGERCFRPLCKPKGLLEGIVLGLDELEALRLSYLEGYDQKRVSSRMRIHQSTISRILASARRKVTDALVNVKSIKIEGGCCKVAAPGPVSRRSLVLRKDMERRKA
ncbi:MAG: DUF134 domain-containing protein [Candidatus Omnitrophota bacterium]|jgi:hypothetical protein